MQRPLPCNFLEAQQRPPPPLPSHSFLPMASIMFMVLPCIRGFASTDTAPTPSAAARSFSKRCSTAMKHSFQLATSGKTAVMAHHHAVQWYQYRAMPSESTLRTELPSKQ